MSVGADGATTGPARTSPARSGTAGLNLESPVQATCGAALFFSPLPSSLPSTSSDDRQPSPDSPTSSLTPSSHPPHVRVSRPRSARDATKSPPALASIVKSATPPSLPQLPPSVAASPPALRRTSPTQSRDEDQSMDQSMSDSKPALASPPPTLSHTALPTSTASAIASSPGSSASPKLLHSNSTSSPLLTQTWAERSPMERGKGRKT
ncbi:hypothetical protein DFH11DRAFT_1733203 [Phellopilus nigrolimitatus]|nr:hypothetical protein DFH11DRAFT_1733203 [Phellopilus nigrolimitatus]